MRISLAVITLLVVATAPLAAQDKGRGADHSKSKQDAVAPGKAKKAPLIARAENGDVASKGKSEHARTKKVVTPSQAVVVTRDVLLANGYQVVQVVPNGSSQVIYYRRGNRGNGRGLGPVEMIVVVPSGSIVQFQSVPDALLGTILRRLGM
jgi:hypothetical protein